jgi:chromosome segregation ATPase
MLPMQQPPRVVFPPAGAAPEQVELDRQLNAILRPTTVEDLARKGGPIKAVKERELRELIRQALLQILATTPMPATLDQEQILDRVQGELRQVVGQRAAEQQQVDELARINHDLSEQFARLESEQGDRAGELGLLRAQLADAESLAHQQRDALTTHVALVRELLSEYPPETPIADASEEILARIRILRDLRRQDQGWVSELQKRQHALMTERETIRTQLEAELDRSIQAEVANDELRARIAELEAQGAGRTLLAGPEPALVAELADLRERLGETVARLDAAEAARLKAERDLAGTSGGRAAAERRLADTEAKLLTTESRLREVEGQLTDQRRTTDLARLASVEVEALRAEIAGLRLRADQDATALADERAASQAERDKHRADNLTRVDAMRRVETALTALRAQLADRERELAASQAELAMQRTAAQAIGELTPAGGTPATELAAARAELKALTQERDWLRAAVIARVQNTPEMPISRGF